MENEKQLVTSQKKGFGEVAKIMSGEVAMTQAEAQAKAEVQARFIMALQRPRDEDLSRVQILSVCKNLRFAESALYKKPIGGKLFDGPSIRFAEEMMKRWGNIDVRHYVLLDDSEKRLSKVAVTDLQQNISYGKDIMVEKTVERKSNKGREVINERINSYGDRVFIVVATEDELMNKELSLASKAIRNCGLRLIPQHIVEEAMDMVKQVIREGIDRDPAAARRKIIDSFSTIGVLPNKLKIIIGHDLESASPAELEKLRSIYTTIKDGNATINDYLQDLKTESVPDKGSLSDLSAGDEATHQSVKSPVAEVKDEPAPYTYDELMSELKDAENTSEFKKAVSHVSRNMTHLSKTAQQELSLTMEAKEKELENAK